ncbi:MAG TPA: site-2 protease family protein [Gemmatimonadaceae bacterium]|nr:site-2 protease family protein [Gemmatimonadaceae bacterium]
MKWSWKLGRFAGIEVRLHATFLILLAWVAFASYQLRGSVSDAVSGVVFILAVFASVILHEYGHALTARHYGIPTKEITLLPIGGVAQLERIPREPQRELAVALAGPAVTVAIAIVLFLILVATGLPTRPGVLLREDAPFLSRLMWVNVWLVIFNAIPAFPMDGGRVLRAALATRMPHLRATRIAAEVGKGFALIFGIIGFFVLRDPFLVFIALFVWLGAAGEAAMAQQNSAFDGVRVERVMIRDVRTLAPGDPLSRAVDEVLSGFQQDFPVVDGGVLVGVLTRSDLMKALAAQGGQGRVGDAMDRSFAVADPQDGLEDAFARLRSCRCRTLPVVRGGELVGVLTTENVGEYMMVQSAMRDERV